MLTISLLSWMFDANAQSDTLFQKKKLSPTEVNFLFNYYEQDGNNSAVTGGIGTEELSDIGGTIVVKAPVDSTHTFDFNVGANLYTSASTDNINSISSASGKDLRGYFNMVFDTKNLAKKSNYGLSFGGSAESDYMSISVGAYYTQLSKDENTEWSIAGQVFWDRWQLFFADELRGLSDIYPNTDKRRSLSLSGTWSQVVNKRLQISATTDLVWQFGMLATPFHRVYLQDSTMTFEWLPTHRFKNPIAIRANYFWSDFIVSRFYGRFYWDSFGIRAGTFQLELPIKIGNAWTFTPFGRFHTQTAANFFEPFAEHPLDAFYRTSDYDLSAFQSYKYGLSVRVAPLYGLARHRLFKKINMLKYLELRYANYHRTNGLNAFIFSMDAGFVIQ